MSAGAADLAVDSGLVRRWLLAARDSLGEHRAEIDALNVFPVPDGDTGTNLYLTLEAGVRGVAEAEDDSFSAVLNAAARGAFMGARGNSGVIFSQMLRGFAGALSEGADASGVARALRAAADAGFDAVTRPAVGTMLTVMAAAADAAQATVDGGGSMARMIRTTVQAADDAVLATQEQHPVLKRHGVVDAGGVGVALVLAAIDTAMTGRRRPASPRHEPASTTVEGSAPAMVQHGSDLVEGGPAFEVMYLLEAAETALPALKEHLDGLGDSLLVVGGEGLWNVHVHVDDVGAAIERGVEAGRPFRIRVTHFAEQIGASETQRHGRSVVTVAAGAGLVNLFAESGATVLPLGPVTTPSTQELLDAVLATEAAEVVLLPNHKDIIPAAQAAAHEAGEQGVRVAVIPTKAQVQGLAAFAVHAPTTSFDQDVVAMTNAAGHVRHGGVTVAAKEAFTTAGRCQVGDVLGIVERDFVVVTQPGPTALVDTGVDVLQRMLSLGGELVTVIRGEDAPRDAADELVQRLAAEHPELDVVVYDGGQARYPLLLGVE